MAKKILLSALAVAIVAGGALFYYYSKRAPSAAEFGVPIYPGAKPLDTGVFYKQVERKDSVDSWQAMTFTSSDPPAKVIAFYKEKLVGKMRLMETSSKGIPSAVMNVDLGPRKTNIVITTDEETKETHIAIASALRQKKQSQSATAAQ